MKKILFISGESYKDVDLQCNGEYHTLQGRMDSKEDNARYHVIFLPNSLVDKIEDYLKLKPSIIHYCGHATGRGSLIVKQSNKKGRILWNSIDFKETLEENKELDCIILCSCNSDKIIEAMGFPADYLIGFQGSLGWESAKEFNSLFYQHLFIYGSALHAYLKTVFILNRNQAQGIKPVFASKINYVMKSVLEYQEEKLRKEGDLKKYEQAIEFAERTRDRINLELSEAEGQSSGLMYQLLTENPFAQEIIYVIDNKEQMAAQVASQIFYGDTQIRERKRLTFEMALFLEAIEKVLTALRLKKYPDNAFKEICRTYSQQVYRDALSRLAVHKFPIKTDPVFDRMWKEVMEEATEQVMLVCPV